MLGREFIVVAVHGEGDQNTVNSLQAHRNNEEVMRLRRNGAMDIPASLANSPDEPPDVIIVLRDAHHNYRIDWPVETWEEVDKWKDIVGWDADKRQWKTGAVVKVQIGD